MISLIYRIDYSRHSKLGKFVVMRSGLNSIKKTVEESMAVSNLSCFGFVILKKLLEHDEAVMKSYKIVSWGSIAILRQLINYAMSKRLIQNLSAT